MEQGKVTAPLPPLDPVDLTRHAPVSADSLSRAVAGHLRPGADAGSGRKAFVGLFMRRTFYLLLILAVLCSGCPAESVNPLSSPGDSKHDNQLTGTWIAKGESGEAWYLYIGKGDLEFGPNAKSIAPSHAISVRHQADGRVSLGTFKIFLTQIDNQKYATVTFAGPKESGMGYLLAKYSIDNDKKLLLWFIDEKVARNDKLSFDRRKLIDSTAKLRSLLASPHHAELFEPEPDMVFEKVAAREP